MNIEASSETTTGPVQKLKEDGGFHRCNCFDRRCSNRLNVRSGMDNKIVVTVISQEKREVLMLSKAQAKTLSEELALLAV